eukprot:scaffold92889_cov26-Tisochrysis_lutea.AAC.1
MDLKEWHNGWSLDWSLNWSLHWSSDWSLDWIWLHGGWSLGSGQMDEQCAGKMRRDSRYCMTGGQQAVDAAWWTSGSRCCMVEGQ